MIKIKKATAGERAEYAKGRPVYPLWGWAWLKGGTKLAVEDLSEWGKEDPQYEVMIPRGYHVKMEMLHTLLCDTQADIRGRLELVKLERCDDLCGETPEPALVDAKDVAE